MKKMLSGVTYYDPERAFNGYTLWSPLVMHMGGYDNPWDRPGEVNLMDMNGNIVHQWKTAFPTFYAYLMDDGHILAGLRTTKTDGNRPGLPPYAMGGAQGYLHEYDWDGNLVFEHIDPVMHHDFKKLPNGNYIYLGWEKVPDDLLGKVLGGKKGTEHADGSIFADTIVEIDPSGKQVWNWRAVEHLDFDLDIIGPIHTREEWSHQNTLWVCEDGDIISSSRHLDIGFKISKQTGDVVWRWGAVAYLDKETGRLEARQGPTTMGGQHDVHVIPSGLPGAGNMLCYDNGMYSFCSRAVEVDMTTNEVVWDSLKPGEWYVNGRVPFSTFISGARRLPNGNTLLCEGQNGRFYEVDYENKDIVWEYYRPEKDDGVSGWAIFRAFRHAPDFCPQFADLPPAAGPAVLL